MKKSIAVIGQGFVGGSLTTVMAEKGLDVYVFDKAGKVAPGGRNVASSDKKLMISRAPTLTNVRILVETMEKNRNVENFSGIYFVCLPTPMKEDGSCDISIVQSVLDELSSIEGERIAVVKSTVPPGTTEGWNKRFEGTGLRIVFNPEFLTEANALEDMRNQDRIILGGPRPHINRVRDIFRTAFPGVNIIKTNSTTGEMVKYITNCFLSVKLSFANEIAQICEALDRDGLDVDYDKCIEYAKCDERLGKTHWSVPSNETDERGRHLRGFGLSCFPKDLNALIFIAKKIGVDPKVMKAAWEKNLEVRPERDWERLIGRAISKKKDE